MANAEIKAIITAEDRASATLANFGRKAGGIGNTVKRSLKLAAVGIAATGAAAIAFGVSSVKSYQESENALTQLRVALKATKGVAKVSEKSMVAFANSMQKVTKFSDEEILSAEALQLTFKAIGKDIFPRVTKAAMDMSEFLGKDLNSTMTQLGKAMQDPVKGATALSKQGSLAKTELQHLKDMAAAGSSVFEQQTYILEALEGQYKGASEAAGLTFAGKLKILGNQFDEVKESIGQVLVNGLSPLMKKLADFVASDQFQAWLKNTTEKATKFVEGINWEKLAADVTAIANAFIVMAKIIGGTISNIIMWQNRFIAIGGRVLFEWQRIINNIKIAWGNLKASIVATGQGIYANIYKYVINPIMKVAYWIQRTIAKFQSMHPAIVGALAGIGNAIIAPFRSAFNWIINSVARVQAAINGLSAGNIGSVTKAVAGAASKASRKASGTDFFTPRKYAGGTSGAYGGMALVGERGPEMVTLPRGSKVSRADETRRMMGGSTTINITVPMMTGSANERRKVARMLIKDIQDIAQMNGKSVTDMMSSNYGLVT